MKITISFTYTTADAEVFDKEVVIVVAEDTFSFDDLKTLIEKEFPFFRFGIIDMKEFDIARCIIRPTKTKIISIK